MCLCAALFLGIALSAFRSHSGNNLALSHYVAVLLSEFPKKEASTEREKNEMKKRLISTALRRLVDTFIRTLM